MTGVPNPSVKDQDQPKTNVKPQEPASVLPHAKDLGKSHNENKVANQRLATPKEDFKGSGKNIGERTTNIVSSHPTSQPQGLNQGWGKNKDAQVIKSPNLKLGFPEEQGIENSPHPIMDMEVGSGVFVPIREGLTTDRLMEDAWRAVALARQRFGEVERDENGDTILEQLTVEVRKRDADGVLMLDDGKPIKGANMVQRPKIIGGPSFGVRAVVAGDNLGNGEASGDGILIIRYA